MDPFSAEGGKSFPPFPKANANDELMLPPPELINIHNAFHQGQYQSVLDFDTSALSPENHLPARILQLRAKIALGQPEQALSDIDDESNPDLAAVKALAQHTAGDADGALKSAQDLAENYPDNANVQVLGGTVLQAQGRSEEAVGLLSKHQGSLEAYVVLAPFSCTRTLCGCL